MAKISKIVLPVLFVVTIIGMIIYVNLYQDKKSQTTNIFDEMYSEVKSTYETNNTLYKINGFKIQAGWPNDSDLNRFRPRGEYLEKVTPATYSEIEVSFNFERNSEKLFFNYYKKVGANERLWFSNSYSYSDKVLVKKVFIQKTNNNSDGYYTTIKNGNKIKSYLTQHHITAKELDTYYDQIVNKKVLKDWCTIYDSKFSPENYGKVKIKTQWKNW